jgi:hypothetical protein
MTDIRKTISLLVWVAIFFAVSETEAGSPPGRCLVWFDGLGSALGFSLHLPKTKPHAPGLQIGCYTEGLCLGNDIGYGYSPIVDGPRREVQDRNLFGLHGPFDLY